VATDRVWERGYGCTSIAESVTSNGGTSIAGSVTSNGGTSTAGTVTSTVVMVVSVKTEAMLVSVAN